jgi:flagellar basal-body rod protein FlgF
MIYGLYLSASGVLANSFRQDVIANNIANSETVGFKKDLTMLQQRPTAAQETGHWSQTDPLLEPMGGGLLAERAAINTTAGDLEPTSNPLDVALQGDGYLAVSHQGQTSLTRNGQMIIDRSGRLVLSNNPSQAVLDSRQNPIVLDSTSPLTIASDGTITQRGKTIAKLGLFNVADGSQLHKVGGTLLGFSDGAKLSEAQPAVHSGFIERSNVDPSTELTALMETQRELEANANMIHIQDETLDKLVNDVGRVG